MTSTDREILIEINGRLMRLETRVDRIESRLERVESGLMQTNERLASLKGKLDIGLWAGGISFAVLAAMITFASIYVPMLMRKSGPKEENSPVIPPSQMTFTLDAVERIAAMIRGYDSSTPSKDTLASPSSTASS